MAKIFIDNEPYEANPKKNLLEVALSLGMDLPYFCWHPAMRSVGACRQCAVKQYKDENDDKGKIVMACMQPAQDGTRISIEEPQVKHFRKMVVEGLMASHPHDCPTCDEGGECHLQDMTVMTGHNYRRYRFKKRTFRNQNLGPFINHEMNRCIQCYRCVRFYRNYADGRDLNAFASKNHVYFGREKDGTLENEFSGNLVEVCPTGVFTDKTLKQHYTRKWDLTFAPSVCHQCSLGCNIIAGERYNTLRRVSTRYNGAVNEYFICDRGRFGYEYVNSDQRIWHPLKKAGESQQPIEMAELKGHLSALAQKKLVGIGSPRASLESNYTLMKLVGAENFYHGVNRKEYHLNRMVQEILTKGNVPSASMKAVRESEAVIIIGEDLTNTAPMLALAVRQAAKTLPIKKAEKMKIFDWQDAAVREATQDEKGPVFILHPHATKLEDIATATYHENPNAIAEFVDKAATTISQDKNKPKGKWDQSLQELLDAIKQGLEQAGKVTIVAGTSLGSEALIKAAANLASVLKEKEKNVQLCFAVKDCNSMGLNMLPGEPFGRIESDRQDATLLVLENDLYQHGYQSRIEQFLDSFKEVVVIDNIKTNTSARADLVLPAGTFAESNGTLVNNEGRAQRFYRVHRKEGTEVRESWRWLLDIENRGELSYDQLLQEMTQEMPAWQGIDKLTPPSEYRAVGQKIPRQSHRYSGRTAMDAHKNVSEPKPNEDPETPLGTTMEGYHGEPPSSLTPYYWAPGWNSIQSINKYQIEVGGSLHDGDPGLRLLHPSENGAPRYEIEFDDETLQGKTVVPLYHIFGSDLQSNQAPALAQRIPAPYLALSAESAKRSGLKEGDQVGFKIRLKEYSYPLNIKAGLPDDCVGLPIGLPGMESLYFAESTKMKGEAT